jgi:hypothetical protein
MKVWKGRFEMEETLRDQMAMERGKFWKTQLK